MYAQVNVTDPEGITTRLVMGCAEPAYLAADMLNDCGYLVGEVTTTDVAPEREHDEKIRALHLLMLVFEPAEGEA